MNNLMQENYTLIDLSQKSYNIMAAPKATIHVVTIIPWPQNAKMNHKISIWWALEMIQCQSRDLFVPFPLFCSSQW